MLEVTDLVEVEAFARDLAQRAGRVLLDGFQTALQVDYKDEHSHDPVTEIDRAVEDLVREGVTQRFPDHAVLGEERDAVGPSEANVVWVVDPLDGTSNFINGLGLFACSIGVLEQGAPVAGAIFLPTNRQLSPGVYHARRGGGLRFDGEPIGTESSAVSAGSRLSGMPAGIGGVTGPRGRRFGVARTLGSIAAELTLAAEGTLQMAVFDSSRIWDVAGGVALALEAGRAVFTRPAAGGPWRRLLRFGQEIPGPVTVPLLRAWNDALVVGEPERLPDAAIDLNREQGARATLRRMVRRQR